MEVTTSPSGVQYCYLVRMVSYGSRMDSDVSLHTTARRSNLDLRPEAAIITTQYASFLVQVLTCQQQSQDHRSVSIKHKAPVRAASSDLNKCLVKLVYNDSNSRWPYYMELTGSVVYNMPDALIRFVSLISDLF
ncbi:hypothetical protein DAPPUDRAFT_236667 [Daphnia pulex]|uniref:Uncharacterized protein n=1 Tax=Daphnia pulex TaxID=6669 RepID=E9G2U0_DAPPU|nr:hypothetical protein DAPPUDRAFT_236667 [Daphnia pulex]|eukprot:EFX86449.1 hypothetical protein DAPPUDRAFT_236667 [Daphnia pulex]